MYQRGDEQKWAKLEYGIGDFNSVDEAMEYIRSMYCFNAKLDITERCVFAVNEKNEIVGSCIVWNDLKDNVYVASLHWLVVLPQYEERVLEPLFARKCYGSFGKRGSFQYIFIHNRGVIKRFFYMYIKGLKFKKRIAFLNIRTDLVLL